MTDKPNLDTQPALLADVAGFRTGIAAAAIKSSGPDVAVIFCEDEACTGAGVFTKNEVAAAPVRLSRANVADGKLRAAIVNAGNANCCTGIQGAADAKEMASKTAELLKIADDQVLVASTGIIGHLLPMAKVRHGVEEACRSALESGNDDVSSAILTTDTRPKRASATGTIGGKPFKIAGVSKGAGMIAPNMATMLAFITTDAAVSSDCLRQMLSDSANRTFNRVTIDGDTSTNDSLCIMASGRAGNAVIDDMSSPEAAVFAEAVEIVSRELAIAIALDGEGATKLVEVHVKNADTDEDADKAGRTIAQSLLVKTAVHGEDPNWGRILAAAGRSGARVDDTRATVKVAGTAVFDKGKPLFPVPQSLHEKMKESKIVIELDLDLGSAEAVFWTCDLSKEYVTINADYHT